MAPLMAAVKKYLVRNESVRTYVTFGRRKNKALGRTSNRSFYFWKKHHKERFLEVPGRFPMVGLFHKPSIFGYLALLLCFFMFGMAGAFHAIAGVSAPTGVLGILFFIIAMVLLGKGRLQVDLGNKVYNIFYNRKRDYKKIRAFVRKVYG